MATLTIEIDKGRDLPILQELLNKMGLEFELEDDDWSDLPEAAIEGIKGGLADIEAGRVHSHEYVMKRIDENLVKSRAKNGN